MTDIKVLAAEVATLFNKQFDNPFNVLIMNSIVGYRATILKQEYDKNGRFPLGSEEAITLPMQRVKAVDCCCSEDTNCVVMRTKDKVPSAIRGNFKPDPFLFVGTADMSRGYIYAQPNEVENIIKGTKFISKEMIYSYYNDYIYTFQSENGKVGIRDVFSNPLQLLELQNCHGKPCLEEVLIEDDMKRVIKQMIIEEFRAAGKLTEEQEIKINETV